MGGSTKPNAFSVVPNITGIPSSRWGGRDNLKKENNKIRRSSTAKSTVPIIPPISSLVTIFPAISECVLSSTGLGDGAAFFVELADGHGYV